MKTFNYFKEFSNQYDTQQKKSYWLLCNEIIWNKLYELIKTNKETIKNVIDLGGGTGIWAEKIAQNFPNINITIVDFSADMLIEAKKKLKNFNNIKYINGDILSDLKDIKNIKFDLCLNIYVSMFINDINLLFKKISNYLNKNAYYIFVGQNIHHTLAMLISNGEINKIDNLLLSGKVQLQNYLPVLYLHNRDELLAASFNNNMSVEIISTFPKYCRTGLREKMTKKNLSISDVLKNEINFKKCLKLELDNFKLMNQDMGMYWFIIGNKK